MSLKPIKQIVKEQCSCSPNAWNPLIAGLECPVHGTQIRAHAREAEGVCSSCGGRTINGTCNARCEQ